MERKYDIEDRCVALGAAIVRFTDGLPSTLASKHLGGQLLRSGTAPALHYGEVQGSESPKDFVHKMSDALKELRESKNNMRIQSLSGLMDPKKPEHGWLMNECSELIAIFNASIKTAQRNNSLKK